MCDCYSVINPPSTVRVSITDPGMTLVHGRSDCLRSGCYKYVGGATWPHEGGGRGQGVGAPPTSCLPGCFLDVGSKSSGSRSFRKSRSRRFHSVWIPFDIPFLRNSEMGKKQQFWAGPPVNRLVPKII